MYIKEFFFYVFVFRFKYLYKYIMIEIVMFLFDWMYSLFIESEIFKFIDKRL